MFSDKINASIAEAVKKCMDEELKGNQTKLDVDKDGKIEASDLKKLRKEESEQLSEKEGYSAKEARAGKDIGKPGKNFAKIAKGAAKRYGSEESGKRVAGAILAKLRKEDTEQIDEKKYEPEEYNASAAAARKKREENEERRREARENGEDKPAVRKIAGKAYGGAAQKDDEMDESVNTFTKLIESFKEGGIKSLFKNIHTEEVDNETFTKEFKDQKAKFDGKKKGGDVAAPATTGVKDMKEETHTEVQVVDMTDGSQKPEVTTIDLEERALTSGETNKKEHYVKSMKKNLAGFKQRYGERAKEVMYATATKMAKEEVELGEASQVNQPGGSRRNYGDSGDQGFKPGVPVYPGTPMKAKDAKKDIAKTFAKVFNKEEVEQGNEEV